MIMEETYEIAGQDLELLLADLDWSRRNGCTIRKISIRVDGGVKVKINENVWTAPMGTLREAC